MVWYTQQWMSPLMTTSHGTPVCGAGTAPGAPTLRRWFASSAAGVVAVAAMLALGAPARADFQAGIDAYARQDYQTALNEWLPYAAQEKPSALFNIGQMYRLGHGVERDLTKAEQYYRRAAELGHIGAMANLGSMMFEQKPPKGDEAVMFWRQAARGGDAKSQYLLGIQYFNGELVAQDYAQAYAWLSLAAGAGVSGAADALATVKSNMDPQSVAAASRLAGTLLAPDVAETGIDMAAQLDSAVLRNPVDDLRASELTPISPAAVQGAIVLSTMEGGSPAPESQSSKVAARAEPAPSRNVEYRAQFGVFGSESDASALKATLLAKHAKLIGKAGVEVEAVQVGGPEAVRYRVRSGLLADEAAAKAICTGVERGGGTCQPAKRIKIPVTVKADMDTEPAASRALKPAPLPVSSPVPVQPPDQPVAVQPPPADPPPAAEPADVTGPWRVQVAAGRTEEEARFRWSRLMGAHADLLDAAELFIFKVDLGDKGVFYRVQIGGFDTRAPAVKFCEKLKARKVECFVTATPR